MKYILALMFMFPLAACAKPTPEVVFPEHCKDYIKPSGLYEGHLLTTENGEIKYDNDTFVNVFQSGGHGTNWSGVTGTAKEDHILFTPPDSKYFQWTVTLEGRATLTDATFDFIYVSEEETVLLRYEFTSLVPSAAAVTLSYDLNLLEDSRELLADR